MERFSKGTGSDSNVFPKMRLKCNFRSVIIAWRALPACQPALPHCIISSHQSIGFGCFSSQGKSAHQACMHARKMEAMNRMRVRRRNRDAVLVWVIALLATKLLEDDQCAASAFRIHEPLCARSARTNFKNHARSARCRAAIMTTATISCGLRAWTASRRCSSFHLTSEDHRNSDLSLWDNNSTFHTASRFVRSFLDDEAQEEGERNLQPFGNSLQWTEEILSVFPSQIRSNWTLNRSTESHSPPWSLAVHPPKKKRRSKRTYRLDVAYLGDEYCGWQRQPHDPRPSVQQHVEESLESLLGHGVDVRASGRTDAAVHAARQVTRFRTDRIDANLTRESIQQHLDHHQRICFKDESEERWCRCLDVQEMEPREKFHPGFGASSRSYVYFIDRPTLPSGSCDSAQLLVSRLNLALSPLVGKSLDYYGLSHGLLTKESYECRISFARAFAIQEPALDDHSAPLMTAIGIAVTADRFLRRMVRILVATAMDHCADESFHDTNLLEQVLSRNRRASAKAAPATGLVLIGTTYNSLL